eukprot:7799417-Pyramimonas_sp.AAC.1
MPSGRGYACSQSVKCKAVKCKGDGDRVYTTIMYRRMYCIVVGVGRAWTVVDDINGVRVDI